jgi:hypothetical protein
MTQSDVFLVIFYLKKRKKPPASAVHLLQKEQWTQISEDSFLVKISMTLESLREVLSGHMKGCGKVSVNTLSKLEGLPESPGAGSWELRFRRHEEDRQMRRRIRKVRRAQSRKP